MAFIGTCPAPHADIKEKPERAIFVYPFPQSFNEYLLPVFREFPVLVHNRPVAGIREAYGLKGLGFVPIAEHALLEDSRGFHPARFMRRVSLSLQVLLVLDLP